MQDKRILELLSNEYPTIDLAASEVINLSANLQLPKGTEYFFSDIHGEYETFSHLVHSASGTIRDKISMVFDSYLPEEDLNELAHLIYEPNQVLNEKERKSQLTNEYLRITIFQLVKLAKFVASKYPREKVRSKFPQAYVEILDELMHVDYDEYNKQKYYREIITTIILTGTAKEFIIALCHLIQNICVDSLHIIGDIYDRGPRPDLVVDTLMEYPNVDIQWGNHDIAWMGAACGNEVLMATVVRIGLRYNNFDFMEESYGINLRPLSDFASRVYRDDPCDEFKIKKLQESELSDIKPDLARKMQKAISVIQFKLASQTIERHPEYDMDDRDVMKDTNWKDFTYHLNGKSYPLKDKNFPTVNPDKPNELTEEEHEIMNSLKISFQHSVSLHKHIKYIYNVGDTYKVINNNLLFHGCIPMTDEGEFDSIKVDGKEYKGKELMDFLNRQIQNAYFLPSYHPKKQDAVDLMWYVWTGKKSPMFGKSRMATFENYFVDCKEVRKEVFNPYYELSKDEEICDKILVEFGLDPEVSRIINGHVPVKIKDGESPVKGSGKLYVIDGGISKAYQPKTGIAGYTLIFNSHVIALAEHRSFTKITDDISSYTPTLMTTETMSERLLIKDTDEGKEIQKKIDDLIDLIEAYRTGLIREKATRDKKL